MSSILEGCTNAKSEGYGSTEEEECSDEEEISPIIEEPSSSEENGDNSYETAESDNIVEITSDLGQSINAAADTISQFTRPIGDLRWEKHPAISTDLPFNPYYLKCEYCHQTFVTRYKLLEHKMLHKRMHYDCDYCGRTYEDVKKLQSHRMIHGEDGVKCEYCLKAFPSIVYLKIHRSQKHPKARYPCRICGKECDNIWNLHLHMEVHIKEDYRCNICRMEFYDSDDFKVHQKTHQNNQKALPSTDHDASIEEEPERPEAPLPKRFRPSKPKQRVPPPRTNLHDSATKSQMYNQMRFNLFATTRPNFFAHLRPNLFGPSRSRGCSPYTLGPNRFPNVFGSNRQVSPNLFGPRIPNMFRASVPQHFGPHQLAVTRPPVAANGPFYAQNKISVQGPNFNFYEGQLYGPDNLSISMLNVQKEGRNIFSAINVTAKGKASTSSKYIPKKGSRPKTDSVEQLLYNNDSLLYLSATLKQ